MGLVDSSIKMSVKKASIKGPVSGSELWRRYSIVMEIIKNEDMHAQ